MDTITKDTAKHYKDHRYVVIKNFISAELADFLYGYALMRANRAKTMVNSRFPKYNEDTDGTYRDGQVPNTYSCYADPAMETLLQYGLQGMRGITGLNLKPTYSYWRLYKTGDVLKRHKDRPSCEVSTTLCLGYDNTNLKGKKVDWASYDWPIWADGTGGVNNKGKLIHLNPGDMVVYRGCEVEHWREPFLGRNHAQVFLHYNNVDGPYGENCVFDGRPHLGLPPAFKAQEKMDAMREADRKLTVERNKNIKNK